jgi:nitrogen-specific signal transduction histidine kinase
VILLAVLAAAILLLRRSLTDANPDLVPDKNTVPRADNAPAFMTASMQAVIQKLRDQEKELERLHKAERERAETTARLSEEVTRNMPSGLLVIGANGMISASNPAAEQALGIKSLLYRRYSEALGESSYLSALIRHCLADGAVFRREQAAHIAPDGSRRELGITISPIQRPQEKATGALCLLSDLTELTALQQQMQFRENLAALGELSAGIAHEFKNALATISGYAQMIQSQPAAADTAENAEKILQQTRSITHVVTEFLRYARPLEISQESVALRPMFERVAAEVIEAQPAVTIELEGAFSDVTGDEALLRQAFLNLVRNAAEAAVSTSSQPKVTIRATPSGTSAHHLQTIQILDNGPGISPDVAQKLFRPFFTTKVNGTGLGLAVVQKILVQHGGQVEARNGSEGDAAFVAQHGAAFIVTLPAARAASSAVKSEKVSTQG